MSTDRPKFINEHDGAALAAAAWPDTADAIGVGNISYTVNELHDRIASLTRLEASVADLLRSLAGHAMTSDPDHCIEAIVEHEWPLGAPVRRGEVSIIAREAELVDAGLAIEGVAMGREAAEALARRLPRRRAT